MVVTNCPHHLPREHPPDDISMAKFIVGREPAASRAFFARTRVYGTRPPASSSADKKPTFPAGRNESPYAADGNLFDGTHNPARMARSAGDGSSAVTLSDP